MEGALVGLAVLACPVGMGLMMWFMARGMKKPEAAKAKDDRAPSLAELKAEQAQLNEAIDRLERDRSIPEGETARR